MIETILLCSIFGIFIIFSFIKGVQLGMRIKGNMVETNKMPFFSKHTTSKDRKTEEYLNEINKINLENIERYDGTGLGQRNFPEE